MKVLGPCLGSRRHPTWHLCPTSSEFLRPLTGFLGPNLGPLHQCARWTMDARDIDLKSALGRCLPVENQRDRRRIDRVSRGVDQEPLAVGRDDVLLPRQEAGVVTQFETGAPGCRERAFRSRRMSREPKSIADRQQGRTVPTRFRFVPTARAGRRPERLESDRLGPETAAGKFRNGPLRSIDTRPTCRREKIGRRVPERPSARMGGACGRHRATRTRDRCDGPVARV